MLYGQWRFRGLDPFVVLYGDTQPGPWESRREAVLTAFAIHAAASEGATKDFIEAFGALAGG